MCTFFIIIIIISLFLLLLLWKPFHCWGSPLSAECYMAMRVTKGYFDSESWNNVYIENIQQWLIMVNNYYF